MLEVRKWPVIPKRVELTQGEFIEAYTKMIQVELSQEATSIVEPAYFIEKWGVRIISSRG